MYGSMCLCTYTCMYTCEIQQYDNLNQNINHEYTSKLRHKTRELASIVSKYIGFLILGVVPPLLQLVLSREIKGTETQGQYRAVWVLSPDDRLACSFAAITSSTCVWLIPMTNTHAHVHVLYHSLCPYIEDLWGACF